MSRKKWSLFFLVTLCFTSFSLDAQSANDPVQFLKSFYAKYFKASKNNIDHFANKNLQYFDNQLSALLKKDYQNWKKTSGTTCGTLDFDPIGATNDMVTQIKTIKVLSQSAEKAQVKIVFKESPKENIVVHLVNQNATWKISDIVSIE